MSPTIKKPTLAVSENTVKEAHAANIEALENTLMPLGSEDEAKSKTAPSLSTLSERMAHYNVPGVSMALIEKGQMVWAKSWGVCAVDSNKPVTPTSLFQAASMSKPVAAFAALRMVDKGELSLTDPINNTLKRWQIPDNEFTRQQPVTLAHLLSHTAGTTVHGFAGYPQHVPQATVLEVLNGSGAANSAAVVVDTLPGSAFRYSGGGSTIFQLAMEDAGHKPFAQLLNELVLQPTEMTCSTYEQPLPSALQASIASGHCAEGQLIPGRYHNHPEQAAASLWTTPTDLAKFVLAVIDAHVCKEGALLSPSSIKHYLSEQKDNWGLGPRLYQQDGQTIGFHHGGSNRGYKSDFCGFLNGSGAVVMTNGEQGGPLTAEIMAAAAKVYGWPER